MNPPERRRRMVGSPTLWKMKADFQITFLKSVGLQPDHYLLDLGCGVLRGGLPIIEYLDEAHYYGMESRSEVLDEGVTALHEAGLDTKKPRLIPIDTLTSANLDRPMDFIWAFSVLFHLTDGILDECLRFVARSLDGEGCFYANVNIGSDLEDGSWQGFPVVARSSEFYEEMGRRHGLQMSDLGMLRSLGHFSGLPGQDAQRMLRFWPVRRGGRV